MVGHLVALLITALVAGSIPLVLSWQLFGSPPWAVGPGELPDRPVVAPCESVELAGSSSCTDVEGSPSAADAGGPP